MKNILFVIVLLNVFVLNVDYDLVELENCVGNCTLVLDWFKINEAFQTFSQACQGGKPSVIRACKQLSFPVSNCSRISDIFLECYQ